MPLSLTFTRSVNTGTVSRPRSPTDQMIALHRETAWSVDMSRPSTVYTSAILTGARPRSGLGGPSWWAIHLPEQRKYGPAPSVKVLTGEQQKV